MRRMEEFYFDANENELDVGLYWFGEGNVCEKYSPELKHDNL